MLRMISTDIQKPHLHLEFGEEVQLNLTMFILFFLGSGPEKGFAVTLGIGIITTLFSAYFFARHLSSYYVMKNRDKKIIICGFGVGLSISIGLLV